MLPKLLKSFPHDGQESTVELWIMSGYWWCNLIFWCLLLQLQQTVVLSKVKHNEQTKDFAGEYTKYRGIQCDSEKKKKKRLTQNTVFDKNKVCFITLKGSMKSSFCFVSFCLSFVCLFNILFLLWAIGMKWFISSPCSDQGRSKSEGSWEEGTKT